MHWRIAERQNSLRELQEPVGAFGGAIVGHQIGRGAAENNRCTGKLAECDGDVAGMVRGQRNRVALLVRGPRGIVHNDQTEAGHGGKQGGASANQDISIAAPHPIPDCVALPQAKLAVEHGHSVGKSRLEAAHCLGRQTDLGHENDGPLPHLQHSVQGMQVYLRLARAGDAVKERDQGSTTGVRPVQPAFH